MILFFLLKTLNFTLAKISTYMYTVCTGKHTCRSWFDLKTADLKAIFLIKRIIVFKYWNPLQLKMCGAKFGWNWLWRRWFVKWKVTPFSNGSFLLRPCEGGLGLDCTRLMMTPWGEKIEPFYILFAPLHLPV